LPEIYEEEYSREEKQNVQRHGDMFFSEKGILSWFQSLLEFGSMPYRGGMTVTKLLFPTALAVLPLHLFLSGADRDLVI
jgi:hypothetical protein